MQFLMLSRRHTDHLASDELDPLMEVEAERARTLYTAGEFRHIWNRTDAPGAAILIEARDEAHAREIVATLPLVQRKLMEFELIGLRPYRGFAPRVNAGPSTA